MFSFRGLMSYFGRFFRGWDRVIGSIIRPIQRAITFVFFSIWTWGRSRNWLYFLQGLPALVMSVAIIAIVGLRWSISSESLQSRYLEKAQSAFEAKEYPMALVGFERLATLGQDRTENLYKMAIALESMGDPVRTFKIMNQLAPPDQQGYSPAHAWMSDYLRRTLNPRQPDPKQMKLVEAHLKSAISGGAADEDTLHFKLGEWYYIVGEFDKAEVHLSRTAKTRPESRLLYAKILESKNPAESVNQAKLATSFYDTQLKINPKNKVARIDLARALTFSKDFEGALKLLNEGEVLYKQDNSDIDYLRQMARIYFIWQSAVAKKDPENIDKQLDLIQNGLALFPADDALLARLLELFVSDNPKTRESSRAVITKTLAKTGSPIAHFLAGMDAWQNNDAKLAKFHLNEAYQLNPTLPIVANNLAFIISHSENPDLPKALKMIDTVMNNPVQDLAWRDTRGRILLKMEKWDLAARDFEMVIGINPDFHGIHEALAQAYDKIDPKIAAEHRELHEQSEKKRLSKKQPK